MEDEDKRLKAKYFIIMDKLILTQKIPLIYKILVCINCVQLVYYMNCVVKQTRNGISDTVEFTH
jgi:hypothetical protein